MFERFPEHSAAVAFQPAVEQCGIDLAKVSVVFQIAAVELVFG